MLEMDNLEFSGDCTTQGQCMLVTDQLNKDQ